MTDAVEVAIESALLDRYNALLFGSPDLTLRAQPNVSFTPPVAGPTAYWMRAAFLPADSRALGVGFSSSNQHYGIFQIDVFYGQDTGDLKVKRLAAQVVQWFKRGTRMTKDGFTIDVLGAPYMSRVMKEDPWVRVMVSVPYTCFASNPT